VAASADDERVGASLRAIRKRSGDTQAVLAANAGVSRRTVGRIEAGGAGDLAVDTLRAVFAAADARIKLVPWWNGASLDQLLDAGHAALIERALGVLKRFGWAAEVEVTYSEWGERGSLDILAGHPASRAVLVGEAKTAFGSMEETNRVLDVKTRMAPKLAEERFGWRPASVSRVLILPSENTARRVVASHRVTLDVAYPSRGRAVRAWLRQPEGPLRGIWFLSDGRYKAATPPAAPAGGSPSSDSGPDGPSGSHLTGI
jgi:transcriptional regulator with XRE-family HTH domain